MVLAEKEKITIGDMQTELIFTEKILNALGAALSDLESTADYNFIGIKKSLQDNDYITILEKFEAQVSLMKCSVKEAKQLIFSITSLI